MGCPKEPPPAARFSPLRDVTVENTSRDRRQISRVWPVVALDDELEHGCGGDGPACGDGRQDPACEASARDEGYLGVVYMLA